MIIWTGDNPPHNPWVDNKKEIYNITKVFIDLLYHKYNYSGPVFPSLGNHEENVADQYNPYEEKNEKEFLVKMGSLYRIWLSDSEYNQFIQTGYYTTLYKNTNLRIISINCFMCDVLNFYLIRNPTDPGNQFEWLENVLRDSEKNGEFVFIIGHIPPGDSTYLSQCSKRYNALVDRFSNIIRGQFYGHTHYDEFRIVKEYFNSTNIAGLILTAPSLTTYSFINPSFRIYDVDSDTKILKDYSQYRLNITEANITPDIKPQFKVAYTAKKAFNIEHLNDYNAIRDNILKMKNDDKWFDIATDIFYAQGIEKDNQVKNKRLPLYLTCRFKEDVFDEYFKCTGYRTWDYAEYINLFIESFSSKWYVKIYDDVENPHNNKNKKDLNFLS
jgi:sphingomyelin phosphodiesterase